MRCSRTEAPSLHRRYPASPVLRASPPPSPARPDPRGMSVGACHATGRASRVAFIPLFHACRRHYPGGNGRCSCRSLPNRWQPSPLLRRVGFRITRFEACSAFTRVAARMVTEPPRAALCRRSASDDVVASIIRSDCYRLERQLPGGIRTRWGTAPSSRRTEKSRLGDDRPAGVPRRERRCSAGAVRPGAQPRSSGRDLLLFSVNTFAAALPRPICYRAGVVASEFLLRGCSTRRGTRDGWPSALRSRRPRPRSSPLEDLLQGLLHQLPHYVAVTGRRGVRFRGTSRYAWLEWSWLLPLAEWADRDALCGPKGRYRVERTAWRSGSAASHVTLRGRQVSLPDFVSRMLAGRCRWRAASGQRRPSRSMEPQVGLAPDALYDVLAHSRVGLRGADRTSGWSRPAAGVWWRPAPGREPVRYQLPRCASPVAARQALDAVLKEAPAPLGDGRAGDIELRHHGARGNAVGKEQHDLRALDEFGGQGAKTGDLLKVIALRVGQMNRLSLEGIYRKGDGLTEDVYAGQSTSH